ncbi:MAG: minor capsid protein [Bacteroidales bacterium]|nr:minor capsid protein [Bacteroidales bacterium]
MLNINIDTTAFEKQDIGKELDTLLFNSRLDLLEIMQRDIEPFVPMKTGRLRDEVITGIGSNDEAYIEYGAPYAPYVYKMGEGTHFTTPGTGGDWYNEAAKVNSFKWIVDFANIVKTRMKKGSVTGWDVSSGGIPIVHKNNTWNIEFENSWDLLLSKL